MSNRTVYVGNVAHHVTQEILITFFSVCGQITNIKIAGDPSYPSLFAFIEFADPNCAATALNLDGQELGGKPIKVSLSRTNINTPFDPTGNNYVPVAHNRSHDPQLTARTVYVSGIDSHQVSEQYLLDFFGAYGNITNYRMCGDPSKSSRFAFIEFSTPQEARNAQSANGTQLGSSTLRVSPSKSAIQKAAPKLTTLAPHQRDAVHRTIHIGNVDINLTEDYLRDYFTNVCGLVTKVALAGDTNHSSRFAFVEFERIEAFQEALKLSGTKLGSKSIKVSPSRSPILAGNGLGRSGTGGGSGAGDSARGGGGGSAAPSEYDAYNNYYSSGYYPSWGYNQNGYAAPSGYSAYGYDMNAYPTTHSPPPSAYHHPPPQEHPAYSPYPADNGHHPHPHPHHHQHPPSYHSHYRERSYHHHHHHRHRSPSPRGGHHHPVHDDYGSQLSGSDTGSPRISPPGSVEDSDALEYHYAKSEHPEVIEEPGVGQKRKREREESYGEPDSKKVKVTDTTDTLTSDPQQQQQHHHYYETQDPQSQSQESTDKQSQQQQQQQQQTNQETDNSPGAVKHEESYDDSPK